MSHAMTTAATLFPNLTIGLDLGDRTSATYEVDAAGACQRKATVPTTRRGLTRYFADRPTMAFSSPWTMGSSSVRVVRPVGRFALAFRNPPPTGSLNDALTAGAGALCGPSGIRPALLKKRFRVNA